MLLPPALSRDSLSFSSCELSFLPSEFRFLRRLRASSLLDVGVAVADTEAEAEAEVCLHLICLNYVLAAD